VIAILDANVLYSARLRDFFVWLALENAFQAHWTAQIAEEWTRNLLQKRPEITRDKLERTQKLMEKALPNALLENIPSLNIILPDPNDSHVLEAAVHAKAAFIVTHNLRDFPESILEPYLVKAINPNDFVWHIIERTPNLVLNAIELQQANLQRPQISMDAMLLQLEAQGMVKVATWLRNQLLH
jgi:predicted nucleic acid-binding protein